MDTHHEITQGGPVDRIVMGKIAKVVGKNLVLVPQGLLQGRQEFLLVGDHAVDISHVPISPIGLPGGP